MKELRKKLKKTQGDIAREIGTNQSTISKIESGTEYGQFYKKYLAYLTSNGADIRPYLLEKNSEEKSQSE